MCRRGGVQHGGKPTFLPDRADPADEVPGAAFRGTRLGERCPLATELAGERLQIQLAIDRHDRHYQTFVCGPIRLRDKGFEDPLRLDPKSRRSFQPVGPGIPVVLELVGGEVDAGAAQGEGRGCSGGLGMAAR